MAHLHNKCIKIHTVSFWVMKVNLKFEIISISLLYLIDITAKRLWYKCL